jgi:hypothetical protein
LCAFLCGRSDFDRALLPELSGTVLRRECVRFHHGSALWAEAPALERRQDLFVVHLGGFLGPSGCREAV